MDTPKARKLRNEGVVAAAREEGPRKTGGMTGFGRGGGRLRVHQHRRCHSGLEQAARTHHLSPGNRRPKNRPWDPSPHLPSHASIFQAMIDTLLFPWASSFDGYKRTPPISQNHTSLTTHLSCCFRKSSEVCNIRKLFESNFTNQLRPA